MQNKIVLITDNEFLAENIKNKVLLLRESDSFDVILEDKFFDKIKTIKPSIIFYHLKNNEKDCEKFFSFLQKIKQTKELYSSSIIIVYEELDENILCNAFEEGISDFLPINASDSEFTIRTIWCLQKREQSKNIESKTNILSQLNVIDKNNNAFTEKYTCSIFKEETKKEWGTFVVIAPDINIRNKISPQTLMNSIKKNVRSFDILGFASDFKIYLWFKETVKEDVLKILEKIRKNLATNISICAGYIETKDIVFDYAEELANKALSKALLKGDCFVYAEEPKKNEINLEQNLKNFKLHKENLTKKLEDIISPLFYQKQTIYEEKLFETKITNKISKDKSSFTLENKEGKSVFTISYPGFTKINIEIIHDIKNSDIKAQKLFVEANEITNEKIEYILNSFIKDFQNYTNA